MHFEVFSGYQFERLVFAYHLRIGIWRSIEWYRQSGSDLGRDTWAVATARLRGWFPCHNADISGMRNNVDLEQIRSIVRDVAKSCALMVQKVADLAEQLELEIAGPSTSDLQENRFGGRMIDADSLFGQLIVDAAAKTITFRGCNCCLGNTLVFRLIERLARRPNQFVPFDRLIRDVWDGQAKSDEAVRSLVKELRDRLRRNGMSRLASAIRGQKKAYALILKDKVPPPQKSNDNPTAISR